MLLTTEILLRIADFSVVVPSTASPLSLPSEPDEYDAWRARMLGGEQREKAFYDEKLVYVCQLSLALTSISSEGRSELSLQRFKELVKPLQVATSCTHLRLPSTTNAQDPRSSAHTPVPSSSTQRLEPQRSAPLESAGLPPNTPMPFPHTAEKDAQYATATESQPVWEGAPSGSPFIVEREGGYDAFWQGLIPMVYQEGLAENPLLAITAFWTLRAGGLLGTPAFVEEPKKGGEEERVSLVALSEGDLLGGLGGSSFPSSRAPTQIAMASLPSLTYDTPQSFASTTRLHNPSATLETSRKSFRAVLQLGSAVQVRMRALSAADFAVEGGVGSETSARVLCIEINTVDGSGVEFMLEEIKIESGSGIAFSPLGLNTTFPTIIREYEIHEFLYLTTNSEPYSAIASRNRAADQGSSYMETSLHSVSIVLTGRPVLMDGAKETTKSFTSRWNSAIDMKSKASVLRTARMFPGRPGPSGSARPGIAPGSGSGRAFSRQISAASGLLPGGPTSVPPSSEPEELVLSLKILDDLASAATADSAPSPDLIQSVKAFEPFWIQVTILNATSRVQHLKLNMPKKGVAPLGGQGGWKTKTPKGFDVLPSDSVLHHALLTKLASNPALIPMENDVRVGALLPRTVQSVRMRVMAVTPGLHTLDDIDILGIDGGFKVTLKEALCVRAYS